MTNVAEQLRIALEPVQPLLTFSWDQGATEIEAVVYEPINHEPTETFKLAPSYARTLMEKVSRFSIDGDGAEYEDFVKVLDQLESAPEPTPLTCSVGDLLDIVLTALDREGQARVSIDGADWLVTR